jgi:hypothetical protein
VEGSFKHCNYTSGSIKCWEFLGRSSAAAQLAVSGEALSSIELIKIGYDVRKD